MIEDFFRSGLWLVPVAYLCVLGWILWKFYHALARIGEELGEIKVILRERSNPPIAP